MDEKEIYDNSYCKKKIRTIDHLKQEILILPINNYTESKLQKFTTFSSTYYSVLLSGIEAYVGDVELLLNNNDITKLDPEKAIFFQNYRKVINYIHSYYNKSNALINKQFVCNFNATILLNTRYSQYLNSYRKTNEILDSKYIPCDFNQLESEMEALFSFLYRYDDIHPMVKAALFYTRFMKIRPFYAGNGLTARALSLLYLYKNGYALGGFYAPEKYMCVNRLRRYNLVLNRSIGHAFSDKTNSIEFVQFYLFAASASSAKLLQYINNPELMDTDNGYKDLSERQKELLAYLKDNKYISIGDYINNIFNDPAQATRDFDKLRDLGYIEKKGFGRSTYYLLRKDF